MFEGKTLLITGGTGSFGNAVLNRFLDTDIKEIRIFSRDEKKQDDMRHQLQAANADTAKKVKFYIGDVRNIQSVKDAMHGVDYIFHAAALKQVPSCEFFPMEAVRTNIIGTDNVLTAAIEAGVKKVICLSTDKAAYPINAMGTSKAMMEKVIVNVAWCDRNYGGSLGSNIPGAVVFTAPTFEVLQKEAKESLEFLIEGLMENGEDVPEWLKNRDYEFEYNIIR